MVRSYVKQYGVQASLVAVAAIWGGTFVVVADAISSGGAPGDIHVVDVVEQNLPAGNWSAGGTHAFGLAAIVELARNLDLMPRKLVVVGVEAVHFDHGAPMSEAVRAAVPAATDAVFTAIRASAGEP